MKIAEIHRKKVRYSSNRTAYYFKKNKYNCLCIIHDKDDDYGEHSTSGARLEIIIHYNNSFLTEEAEKINISDVPKRVIDVLTYLL